MLNLILDLFHVVLKTAIYPVVYYYFLIVILTCIVVCVKRLIAGRY